MTAAVLAAVGLAAYLSSPPPAPPRRYGSPIIPPDVGPIDAPPELLVDPDFPLDATRVEAAASLGAIDSFVLRRGERTLWAFVLTHAGQFELLVYELDHGAWRQRLDAAELSVQPHLDADPSRAVTGMRMRGMDVPFMVIVDEHDVRFEPGEGFVYGPPTTLRP